MQAFSLFRIAMFSDTHCHLFSQIDTTTLQTILPELEKNFCFVQDIGTKPDDFIDRYKKAQRFYTKIPDIFRFSLGIWPSAAYIADIERSLHILEENIKTARQLGLPIALGECGLDRYWNGENAKNHHESSATEDIAGEESLFEKQLMLAKKYRLPVIVHSRDAFAATLKVIDKVGYHYGVIHCYSYGVDEAQQFLERGWYISFSGNCTFATTHVKKAKTAELVKSVPMDKLLLETDAPYLTPAPHRGKTNNPLYVKYVYEKVAQICGMSVAALSTVVFENARKLFDS